MSELEQKILKNPPSENFFEEKFRLLGFEQLTEIQKNALPIIYQKKDSLIVAPTGSGKTECATIPIFSKLKTKKIPISPYGFAKLKSYRITKKFREKYNLPAYNAIIFNTESTLRQKDYLIPKICIAAINAKKFGKKTKFGNLKIAREWNWCSEQCEYLLKFLNKKPQDFILSNGKLFTAIQMIKFAFGYFNIDYKLFILQNKKFFRKIIFEVII
mgnify:CR=1 FL=1